MIKRKPIKGKVSVYLLALKVNLTIFISHLILFGLNLIEKTKVNSSRRAL